MKRIIVFSLILATLILDVCLVKGLVNNYSLDGYVIYVDAGHGGKDNGASYDNVLEDEINLIIAKKLVASLVNDGAIVYTTRDDDYDLATTHDKNRKAKDLLERVKIINDIKPNLFISLHLNTYALDTDVHGGQVFYQNNENSKKLADSLQSEFNKISTLHKTSKIGDYYLLNKTIYPGVIVECGFLTNEIERNNLQDNKYQLLIVEALMKGIKNYLFSK